jgi:hypothetical protein
MTDERRSRSRSEPLLAPFAKMERGRGIVELMCRVCGVVIGKPMPVGEQRIRRLRDRTIVETGVQFCYLANYREVELEVEGGKHVGCVCVDCAPKLQANAGLLASFWESDLKQWRSEGITITAQMDRRPTKVLRVAEYIRD